MIKSTGGVANVSAKDVDKLAGSLLKKTGIDDEQIKAGENWLLTFKNVRNEAGRNNDIFTRATKTSLDLARAMANASGGQVNVAKTANMLGKALNDPVKGMTALGRAGVTFSDAQKKTITDLVKTGHTLEAQKMILAEVESQVGGSAAAYGKTLVGALDIVRERFRNFLADSLAFAIPALTGIADAAAGAVDFLGKVGGAGSLKLAIDIAGSGLKDLGTRIRDSVQNAIGGVDWGPIGRQLGVALAGAIVFTDAQLSRGVESLIGAIRAHAQDFANLGAELAVRMVATLFDVGFWAHHWQLAVAIASIFLLRGLGKVGGEAAGRLMAAVSGRLVGLGKILLAPFERLPGPVRSIAGFVGRVLAAAVSDAVGIVRRALGKIPGAIQAAFKVGAVVAFIGVLQKVATKVQDVYNWLKKIAGQVFHATISISVHVPGASRLKGAAKQAFESATGIQLPAGGGTIPMLPGAVRGQDSVPALLTPGEIVLNRAQQNLLGGPRYLQDLFGFERFASGGTVGRKPRHRAPHLPASIREAEARARGTETLTDDIRAAQRHENWIDRELKRGDLTRSERESLRVSRITTHNRIKSLKRRQATRNRRHEKDYSQLPARIQKRINKARYENDNVALLAALEEGKAWLLTQLNRHGLSNQQQSDIYAALDSIDSEIQSVQDEINAPAEQTQDEIAQGQQAYDQGFAAGRGQALEGAFAATGVFGGGGAGGGSGGGGGAAGGSQDGFGFYEYHPLSESKHLGRATRAIVGGISRQGYRQATRKSLGI